MNVEIRTRGFSLTPALRAHVERRLGLALDRFADRIARVRVSIGDVNGPRGGADKRCRVEVRLRGGLVVRASVADVDAYGAVDAAAHRASRSLARALERERTTMLELLWLARAVSRRRAA